MAHNPYRSLRLQAPRSYAQLEAARKNLDAPTPCLERTNEFFSEELETQRRAAASCGGCPLISLCLQYAVDAQEPWGAWGGMTQWERSGVRFRQPNGSGKRYRKPLKPQPTVEELISTWEKTAA